MKKFDLVYIVDDDEIVIMLTEMYMNAAGFANTIKKFKNAPDTLADLRNKQLNQEQMPDIIFLDLNMKIMDGWEFLEEFAQMNISGIGIYIFSSSINPLDLQKARSSEHIKEFISKPITESILKKIAESV